MNATAAEREAPEMEAAAQAVHLDALALAGAAAAVAAAAMVVLGAFGAVGLYEGAVAMMVQWHLFFEPTVVGTVAGTLEAAVVTFAGVYAFAWLYNSLAR